jgi:nucleotide-binding universal stress UspA family protein
MAVVVSFVPTQEGRAALRRAAEESRLRRTALVVVESDGARQPEAATEEARAELDRVRADLTAEGVPFEVRTPERAIEPATDLLAVADQLAADVIVIGLRRRSPVGKLLLGSNAQRILLDASCPVLAVKADEVDGAPA